MTLWMWMHLADRRDVRAMLEKSRSLQTAELTNLALCAPKEMANERDAHTRALRRDPFAPEVVDVDRPAGRTVEEWFSIAERFASTRKAQVPVS